MIFIDNNPALSEAFRNEELKKFLKKFLIELENPHTLKSFLTKGAETLYNEQLEQLQKSFVVIKKNNVKTSPHDAGYVEVERCIDGVRFKVGDKVIDLIDPKKRRLPIGRIYEDNDGLHIRLDVQPEPHLSITWRDLSTIAYKLPVKVKDETEED